MKKDCKGIHCRVLFYFLWLDVIVKLDVHFKEKIKKDNSIIFNPKPWVYQTKIADTIVSQVYQM